MSLRTIKDSSKLRRRRLWLAISLVVMAGAVVLLFSTEDNANVTRTNTAPPLQAVTVLEATSAEAIAKVSVFGELRPRWDADIRAAVSGRISNVHDGALAGGRVEAGAPLFSIEKTQYETALAQAELRLEEAQLSLLEAKNDAVLSREEAELLRVSEPNDLVLRLPQLRIAERAVASTQAQLQDARKQLADTEVTAPFSGFITV